MPQESLSFGPPTTLRAGIGYALPAAAGTLFTDAAAPTLTQSNTQAFTANVAVVLTAGAARVAGGFIKAAADCLVTLKRD